MTMKIGDMARIDDLYKAIVARIEADDLEGALALYNTVQQADEKLNLLIHINQLTIDNLVAASDHVPDVDVDRARALGVDPEIVVNLTRDLAVDLADAVGFARTLVVDLPLQHAHVLAGELASEIKVAHNRARIFALMLPMAKPTPTFLNEILSRTDSAQNLTHFITAALPSDFTTTLTFEDIETLTPQVLRNDLAPYLQWLFDLERLLVEAKGSEFQQPKIKTIRQNSPITVELTGIPEAIKVLRNLISPFWRQYAQEKAQLELMERKVTLARSMLGENATPEQIEWGIQIIDGLNRKPPTLPEI